MWPGLGTRVGVALAGGPSHGVPSPLADGGIGFAMLTGAKHMPAQAVKENPAKPSPLGGASKGSSRGPLLTQSAERRHRADDPLDPSARQTAQLGPPAATLVSAPLEFAAPDRSVQANARASLEGLLPALVRRVAWSGDARRGMVRLELGSGALAGSTLRVECDEGRVRVHLDAAPGVDLGAWKARIAARLVATGLTVDAVEVE
jgi:hypothetical protein